MNPDKLLSLLMGKCLKHQWNKPSNEWGFFTCKLCGAGSYKPFTKEITPSDYSDPCHRDEFFTWLCRERDGMFYEFTFWAYTRKCPLPDKDAYYVWLFFQSPSRPRDLMAEWLMLDETVERFGWEECPNFNPNPKDINCLNWNESCHCRNSRILSAWARYAKEAK